MPGNTDGIDLAQQATRLHPTLQVLLTSGFPDLGRAEQRMTIHEYPLLNKPYRHDDLACAVRQVLDAHDRALTEQKVDHGAACI